jgi:hypothetical protein
MFSARSAAMRVRFDAIAVATAPGYVATAPMAWKGYGNAGGGRRLVRMSRPHATTTQVVEKIIHLRENDQFGPITMSMYLERYHDSEVNSSGVWRILNLGMSRYRPHCRGSGHRDY